MNQKQHVFLITLGFCLVWVAAASATPQFARTYRVDCSFCHVAPPMLNERGEQFARGYRFEELRPVPSHRTLPVAVWSTVDVDRRAEAPIRAFPSRIELLSGGTRGAFTFFVEWRALSQQVGSDGRLLDRSGRFEDLSMAVALPLQGMRVRLGQFRALSQVHVSRRLSISEPLAFSSSIPGTPAQAAGRLTSLRAFSPAGRHPGLRLEYHGAAGGGGADGWYWGITVPLGGELTVPLAEGASFELERRPKGIFLESFRRSGLSSMGGHVFLDADRALGNLVSTIRVTSRLHLLGAGGFSHATGLTDGRLSAGGEYIVHPGVIAGARLDHRTRQGRDPALLVYLNGHLPFGAPGLRQALRLQVEQRLEPGRHATGVALSHLF